MEGFVRFINTSVPIEICNLRCEYCYLGQQGKHNLNGPDTKSRFRYSVEHMIKALSVERLGGPCMFNFCGSGETLLCPEIMDISRGLLEGGHYVTFVTNCTVRKRIEELTTFPAEYRARLFLKISYHYAELKARNMLELFSQNVRLLKEAGIAYSFEIITSDHNLPVIDELKEFSMKNFGALPHVLLCRDEVLGNHKRMKSILPSEEYKRIWDSFDSTARTYQDRAFDIEFRDFCYAGVYSLEFSLETGDAWYCPGTNKITNLFEDIENPVLFTPIGKACPFPNCYNTHAEHAIAGVSREFDPGVTYAMMRDRTCEDGSHWLSPGIREAFSHRCSEFHEPISENEMFYINMLMQKVYKDIEPTADELGKLSDIVGNSLKNIGFHKIAVYRMEPLGRWLLNILEKADIEVVCIVDGNWDKLDCGVPAQSPDEQLPPIDTVVVSEYGEFTSIAPWLRSKTSAPLLSIVQLADSHKLELYKRAEITITGIESVKAKIMGVCSRLINVMGKKGGKHNG